jgi:hypothetical protein
MNDVSVEEGQGESSREYAMGPMISS